ncbi:uncharacterized protein sgo2 [Notothenia coriiceps]|uniref:Uncharacterized protein sgo2 n=1 Tax=Notothenia coriiceps TaxID=8208 RepID=A0A6I9PJN4_9TELE|nr:PREDICTED: shugoshin-like 2 [Notothenia coriiceps]
MLPMRTMASLKPSKLTSATVTASKIKHKILNSSSFFKISLKTNNKALAVALEVQKERSRELEMYVMHYQKQVEALCFELATKKYKQRKLLLILDTLRSNTLEHLDMVDELFSDGDKVPEDNKTLSCGINNENLFVESPTDEQPSHPEMAQPMLCPFQKEPADLPEKKPISNVANILNRPIKSTDTFNDIRDTEKRHSSQLLQIPQRGKSRPSSSLTEGVERLSIRFSQPGMNMKSIPCLQKTQPPSAVSTCEKPNPSLPDDVPLEQDSKQEKTVLLNTSMEMTVSDSAEIVVVETKAKRKARSEKPKAKKDKEQAFVSSVAENPKVKISADLKRSEVQSSPTGTLLQTEGPALHDVIEPDNIELPLPKTLGGSGNTSRIPRPNTFGPGNHKKMVKNKQKSHDPESKTDSNGIGVLDLDDYFTDPDFENSKVCKIVPVKETAEIERRSRVTCRRSRVKSRSGSSAKRKTFVAFPLLPCESESESNQSTLQQAHIEVEEERHGKYEACNEQEPPEEFPFCADEVTRSEFSEPQCKMRRITQRAKCRGTFVVSVARESIFSIGASPEVSALEQDLMPSTETSTCGTEEPATVMDACVGLNHSESNQHSEGDLIKETPSSCKHPWRATMDREALQEDFSCNDDLEVLALDQEPSSASEVQISKKARREGKSKSTKKKVQRGKRVDNLSNRKKKDKRISFQNEVCYLGDGGDASHHRGVEKVERHGKYEACNEQEPPEEFPFCADEVARSEFSEPQCEIKRITQRAKCRGTFMVSVARECIVSIGASPEVSALEQDLMPSTETSPCGTEEPATVMDASPHRGDGVPERNEEQLDDLQMADLHPHINEDDESFGDLFDSKSGMAKTPNWCRRTSTAAQTSTGGRKPMETLVVYRRKTQDIVTLKNKRTTHVLNNLDTREEAVRQDVGNLLMDEMPPWMGVNVLDDTKIDSLLATPRRKTSVRAAKESPAVTAKPSPGWSFLLVPASSTTTMPLQYQVSSEC